MNRALARAWEERPELVSALLVVLVALAATVTSLANGFAYDDIPIIVRHPMVQHLGAPWAYFTESYWGPDRGNTLYRPITVLAYALQRAVGGGDPSSFHAMNVALYVATCLAALALAREFLGKGPALVAATLWAAHPVHVEAVGNVVGQAEMLAGIPLLLGVLLYVRDRKAGALRGRTIAGIALLFVLALLSKEHGILLPGLLVLTEVAFRHRRFAPAPDVDRSLVRLAKAFAALVVLYFAVRYAVLGAMLGDAPHPALEKLSAGERVLTMLGLLPIVARLLTWPAELHADYSPQFVQVLPEPALGHLPGVAIVVAYLVGLVVAWRRDRSGVAVFALLWLPATWVLVSNLLFPSGVLIAERTLLLPSITTVLLAGLLVERLGPVLARTTPRVRLALAGGVAGLVLIATVQSAQRQRVWEDNATLFSTSVVDAPSNFKMQHAMGEMFAGVGQWERAERYMLVADSLFPGYELVELGIALVRHRSDRCPLALPYYDSVLVHRPDAEAALVGQAACWLEMRQLTRARDAALAGVVRGNAVGVNRMILQKAESSLVATDTVDARNRWFRAGRPTSKSSERLRVPITLLRRDEMAGPGGAGKTPEFVPDSAH